MSYLADVAALVGLGLLAAGLAQYSSPLGLIVPGVGLLALGLYVAAPRRGRR
jgi:hypothetical protein